MGPLVSGTAPLTPLNRRPHGRQWAQLRRMHVDRLRDAVFGAPRPDPEFVAACDGATRILLPLDPSLPQQAAAMCEAITSLRHGFIGGWTPEAIAYFGTLLGPEERMSAELAAVAHEVEGYGGNLLPALSAVTDTRN
ncbi:MAG: hypothetical protein JOZ49_13425, partial [Mycolicibacterium sp.]|nr:hypothetical protein [Mycolicibacterium sp.]